MSENTADEIATTLETKSLEENLKTCNQILLDCKNDLDKFPSNGANYFSFPELPDHIKLEFENLPQEKVNDFISEWAETDLKDQLVDKYGHRTFGYFMTNLMSRKRDFVGNALNKPTIRLLENFYDHPNDEIIIKKIYDIGTVEEFLPREEQMDFQENLSDSFEEFKSNHPNFDLNNSIPYSLEGFQIVKQLDLFKSGIITSDLLCEKNRIFLTLDNECLLPLEALYEREKNNIEQESLSEIAMMCVIAEAMNGKEINPHILSSINEDDYKSFPQILCLRLADQKIESLSPNVQKIINEITFTKSDVETILQGLIVCETKFDENSFIYNKLQTIDYTKIDLSDCISAALNLHNGNWDQVNPLIKSIIENEYQNVDLEPGEISSILSAVVELNCKLPAFLETAFSKPENIESLLKSVFSFQDSKPVNGYSETYIHYKNINRRILSEGLSIYPNSIQEIFKNNLRGINKATTHELLELVIPKNTYRNINLYKEIGPNINVSGENDYKFYNLVSQDIWNLLKDSDINEITNYINRLDKFKDGNLVFSIPDESDNEQIVNIPIENFLHPDIINKITQQVFPEWKIESSSLIMIDKLNFIINDEMLKNFSEIDKNFLKFTKKYPGAGKALFVYKDKYFTKNVTDNEIITPNLISSLVDKIPKSEAKTLTLAYMDINKDNLDLDFLKNTINNRFFPSENATIYIKDNEEYNNIYQKLYEQSKGQEWADTISNVDSYWESNSMLLVNLLEIGFKDLDFQTFRMLNSNPNVIEIFNDDSMKIDSYSRIVKQISINPHNLTYINYRSMFTLDRILSFDNPKEQLFYRRLLSEQPRSFNNAISALSNNKDIDINNSQVQEQIFSVIGKIGNISPMVLKNYINETDPIKKEEFLLKIKTIKEHFLLNEPVKNTLSEFGYGNEVLAELITLSFPGTNLKEVEGFLAQLDDQCEDLKDFSIRKDGYIPDIKQRVKNAILKDGEEINQDLLKNLREMFPRSLNEKLRSEYKDKLTTSLIFALKTKGAFNFDELKESVPAILSIMYDDEPVQEFRKTSFDFSQPENVTTFLGRVTELLGIYFKDNFESKLLENLDNNLNLSKQLKSYISPQFIVQATKNMGKVKNDQEKENFQKVIENITTNIQKETPVNNQDLAKLITFMLEHRIFTGEKGLRTQIKKEYKKFNFVTSDKNVVTENAPEFKGFVSKNAASFFAKTSAGICTAGDTTLFRRKDHFHINLVDNETIVGNIQGYIIEYQGQKALLFRGFNPSVAFVNPNNADMIAEGMVSIVNKFAAENSIPNVFITEQTGWHSLTNRVGEGIINYFQKNYLQKDKEVEFTFPVTQSQNINKMYKIN